MSQILQWLGLLKDEALQQHPTVVVKTKLGEVKGEKVATSSGTVLLFNGIPFAAPPVGSLRFRKPIPMTAWLGALDCRYGDDLIGV